MAQSKYKSKASNGKKNFKKAVKRVAIQGDPVFVYHTVCCSALAEKKPLLVDYEKEFKDREGHLGSWRCTNCKKKAKVTRSRRVVEEVAA